MKDLKKLNKKLPPNLTPEQNYQLNEIKDKLEQATREKELAKIEASGRVKEQEAVKMIRFKAGINKMTIGYLDVAEKVSL